MKLIFMFPFAVTNLSLYKHCDCCNSAVGRRV
jgi:hypothetical protein